jgi:hypothetical protein
MYHGPVHKPHSIFRLLSTKVPVEAETLEADLKPIYNNINKDDAICLLGKSRELCKTYIQYLDKVNPLIKSSLDELDSVFGLNKYQQFKLDSLDSLYVDYRQMVCKLEFLQRCDLCRVNSLDEKWIDNPISQILYMGIVLAIVSDNYYED